MVICHPEPKVKDLLEILRLSPQDDTLCRLNCLAAFLCDALLGAVFQSLETDPSRLAGVAVDEHHLGNLKRARKPDLGSLLACCLGSLEFGVHVHVLNDNFADFRNDTQHFPCRTLILAGQNFDSIAFSNF